MLRLRYTINCRREFRQVRLGIECPEQWRFSWDGVPFEAVDRGYWCDEAIRALELPADFLKRWLLRQDDKKHTPETIDADFEKMTPDLQWQLVKEKLVADLAVKVEEADFLNIAKLIAVQQFAQYGMTNIPDDVVERYAKEILDNKEYRQRIAERAVEDKMYAGIKEAVNIEEKTVSVDDFNALFKAEEETAAE